MTALEESKLFYNFIWKLTSAKFHFDLTFGVNLSDMIHEVNFNQSKERIISERSQTIYTEGWFLENFSGKQLEHS